MVEHLVAEHGIDLVFSDMRYGCQSSRVPSIALCHQIEFVMPKATGFMKPLADRFNLRHLESFSAILVPDFADESGNLSGRLSHNRLARRLGAEYVGILSSVTPSNVAKDIDYLFILSGYLSEHAKGFIARLVDQAGALPGKKVFVLGDMTRDELEELPGDITIHSHATGLLRNELLNRARVVISRSGYTTVMDLVEIGGEGGLHPHSETDRAGVHRLPPRFRKPLHRLRQPARLRPVRHPRPGRPARAIPRLAPHRDDLEAHRCGHLPAARLSESPLSAKPRPPFPNMSESESPAVPQFRNPRSGGIP